MDDWMARALKAEAEVERLRAELAAERNSTPAESQGRAWETATAEHLRAEAALDVLDDLAAWGDGPEVGAWFDDPDSAEQARELLAKVAPERVERAQRVHAEKWAKRASATDYEALAAKMKEEFGRRPFRMDTLPDSLGPVLPRKP